MVATKDYLLLDGSRYAYDKDSFRAFSLPLDIPDLKAKRRLAPFVSAELTGFQGGIAGTLLDDEGTTVGDMLGFEPDVDSAGSATSSLRVAHQLQAAHSAAGSGVLQPLVADHGYAFAGEQGSDRVFHSSDGVTWTGVSVAGGTAGTVGIAALLARHVQAPNPGPFRRVWASFWDDEHVYGSNDHGATWELELDFEDAIGSVPVFGSGTIPGTAAAIPVLFAFQNDSRAWCVAENYGDTYGQAAIGVSAGGTADTSALLKGWLDEAYCRAGVMVGQVMWVAGADVTDPVRCALYTYDPLSADTQPQKVATLEGNYFTGATEHEGDTYWGGAVRGELYVCDGTSLSLARTFPTTQPIRGLASWRGSLYVAISNDSAGRLEVWRMDAEGRWTVPHSAGGTLDAGQLINFTDALYVATGHTTTGAVYRVSATDHNTAASFETPDIALGAPSLPKRWRRFATQHAALGIGQSVGIAYSTDGGSTWGGTVTDYDVGSTESAVELGDSVLAPLARFRVSYAGGTAQSFAVRSAVADALPVPDAREVWTADLRLRPRGTGAWQDGTADTADALRKHAVLRDLQGETFQVVSPLHGNAGYPDRAFLASLDPQVPLEWRMVEAHPNGQSDVELIVPVRLVQAAGPFNRLENAGFERGTAGWSQFGTAAGLGTVNFWREEGTASLQLHFDGTSTQAEMFQLTTGNATGRYFTLSGWLWQEMGGGSVQLVASAGGTAIPGGTAANLGAGTSSAWTRYQASFLLPDWTGGSVTVECRGYQFPNGTAYFDALMLEEQVPASDYRERGT